MVTLSGGPLGGEVYDGSDWTDGEVKVFEGEQYRRHGDQAVYTGPAPA